MSKKFLIGLAPLLAVAAFAIAPAMAQAAEWLSNEQPITAPVPVVSHATKEFVLKTAAGGEVRCTTLADNGELTSTTTALIFLKFSGCSSPSCPSPGNVEVHEFHVTLEILAANDVDVFLLEGEPVIILCNGAAFGEVTETKPNEGILAVPVGKRLRFTNADNLSFNGEAGATISGEDEQEGAVAKESITVS